MKWTVGIAAIIAVCVSLSACSGGSSSSVLPSPLLKPVAARFPIDGIVDLAAVGTVHQKTIDILDAFGTGTVVRTSTIRWAARNDDLNLYLALEWDDPTPMGLDPASFATSTFDGVVVLFDNDGDGTFGLNEDARRIVMTIYGSSYSDIHAVPSGNNDADAIGDGLGKMTWSSGAYHAEFLIQLAPDAKGEDGILNAKTRFNIDVLDDFNIASLTGKVGSLNGPAGSDAGTDSSSWPQLPYAAPAAYDQPKVPGGLTGRIAFISDRENPLGDIYTFDPATRVVTRVTDSTLGLYVDGVSLSHDRTKIAFYAAPANTDFANYEIYTVDVNGSNLRSITSNSYLDGHPAWSPDDSRIAYASFRNGGVAGPASIIVCSSTGTEIANLTAPGVNDNDPDWLPDGRIVFKTDQFSTYPEVRIAVMDSDGTNVIQVTGTGGTSDHDPTATSTVSVFERFMKGTDYSQDPAAVYSSWNIIEARLDGSGERTLIGDGWVNWLPVHDPTGTYLVYLKSVGYTDARIMTRDGRDLGRLIPDDTMVRYIDWK